MDSNDLNEGVGWKACATLPEPHRASRRARQATGPNFVRKVLGLGHPYHLAGPSMASCWLETAGQSDRDKYSQAAQDILFIFCRPRQSNQAP